MVVALFVACCLLVMFVYFGCLLVAFCVVIVGDWLFGYFLILSIVAICW